MWSYVKACPMPQATASTLLKVQSFQKTNVKAV